MKIRLSAFSDEAGSSLAEQIDALRANKIPMTELRSVGGKNVAELSIAEAKEIYASLSGEGISLSAVGSPMGKVNISVDMNEYLDTVKHICELAKVFNTDKIRMFSFFEAHNERSKVIENLCRMVEVADSYGVGLYHENEKGIYGDTAQRVLDLHDNVKGLHFVYDPANFLQVGENSDKTLPLLVPITDYFHIKDVILEGGELVPAGEGDGQIPRMVSMIEKDTFMTLEPHLKIFGGYDKIDGEVMKHKFHFESNREAFDYAVGALKGILINNGYTEKDGGFVK
ncbi:MAG: sugar phosphate isomerase/epimerase [Ruminococcaceae bacterium]|nr:sugar phosphate isomerase/epimerase [Oscillospiraceae bacterium]